jgi:hypothetical protein
MTIDEALTKQAFIVKLKFKNGSDELSKDLMVRIMKARIKLNKVRTEFDEDLKKAVDELQSPEFKELQSKETRTDDEQKVFTTLVNKINEDANAYVLERVKDEAKDVDDITFTEDEFNEIIPVNVDVEADINGTKLVGPDFLEAIHSIFVKEEKTPDTDVAVDETPAPSKA